MGDLRFDWYQDAQYVVIDVFIKNLNAQNVQIIFNPTDIKVKICDPNCDYEKQFDLFAEIQPEECSFICGKLKIEIKLKKVLGGSNWPSLPSSRNQDAAQPKHLPSAKSPNNFSTLPIENDEEPSGEAAINSLFQKIYADASDDTRRAMMKSFIESKGTVLSTNWNEVGSKHIEPVPPKNNN